MAVSRSGRELPPRPPKRTRRAPKPTTTIPADWAPSDRHRDYATERGLDLARCMIAFVGHAESTGRECVSWDGAFTTWLAKERGDDHRGSRPRPTGPAHAPTFDASQTGFR